jgi:hypothetical protein
MADFRPSNTTPPIKKQPDPSASGTDRDDAPNRKPINTTAAAKGISAPPADQEALNEFTRRQRERAAGEQDVDADGLTAADRAAGITPAMIAAEREQKQTQDEEDDREPWEISAEEQQQREEEQRRAESEIRAGADIFERHRRGKGHELEIPANVHALDEGMVSDLGFMSKQMNLPQEAAQNLLGGFVLAIGSEREALKAGGGEYDPDRTISTLRGEWGSETEGLLDKIVKYTTANPVLADYLDSTGLGSSPEVLRYLMGAITVGTKPAQARAFLDKMLKDPKSEYWKGSKKALAQVKYAYALAGDS